MNQAGKTTAASRNRADGEPGGGGAIVEAVALIVFGLQSMVLRTGVAEDRGESGELTENERNERGATEGYAALGETAMALKLAAALM